MSRKVVWIGSSALFGVTLVLFHKPLLLALGDLLVVQEKLAPVDVIHVISGLDHRPNYAIQLYKQEYAKWIFFTGGWCPYHHVNHAQHSRDLALEAGIPDEAIVTDEAEIDSTYAEALRLKEWIQKRPEPVSSLMVVSDPHHMWRTRWTYRRIFGPQIKLIMAPVPFEFTPDQRQWWRDATSRKMVRDEVLKIAYYFARYQISRGSLQAWLASLDQE